MTIQGIVFDAYGTLFDVYSIGELADNLFPGNGHALAAAWREKQVEYTRLRSMSSRYKPFWDVTRDALVFCCRKLGIAAGSTEIDRLMAQYAVLSPFPENLAVLHRLREKGLKLAILSNGNPPMLHSVIEAAGMASLFDHVLSVHSVGKFKTAPETYQLGPDAFGVPAKELLFVSSNCWDVCGATWFGYTTFWVNRANMPMEELDVLPDARGSSLTDLETFVEKA